MFPYSFIAQGWAERPEYKAYLRVRERILAMMEARQRNSIDQLSKPSGYWAEEIQRILYMLDASPEIIRLFRHHTFAITGINAFAYRTNAARGRERFEQKLRALQEVDQTGLRVSEPRQLGGFGYEIDGDLYNIDTLKFYEAIIAMDLGGALARLKQDPTGDRQMVMEVGGGWGGLAYQFKTLFPGTTYIIIDLPEVLLFSSTYLLGMFPDAKAGFLVEEASDIGDDWSGYDFVFVPNHHLDQVRPGRLDLLTNTVSFMEMTEQQVEAYVQAAWDLDCPLVYSLNRPHSLYSEEVGDVQDVIERRYFTNEIGVLDVAYTELDLSKKKAAKRGKGKASKTSSRVASTARQDLTYRHLIGWRKPRPQ